MQAVGGRLSPSSPGEVPLRVILDTNVVLDALLQRQPSAGAATAILAMVERSEAEGLLCATTITTLDYLLSRAFSPRRARQTLWRLISVFEVAVVNRGIVERALGSRIPDFEDAVLDEAGRLAGTEVLVTGNTRHFSRSELEVFSPRDFLRHLELL